MLSTFMKHLAAFLIICAAVVGYFWVKISDHSPLNTCEPTDVVRIKLDGRVYHIPVEWQPSISQRVSDRADFPTRFSYEDLQGNAQNRGWWSYCQKKRKLPEEFGVITITPRTVSRVNGTDFWNGSAYKYISMADYISVRNSKSNLRVLSDPPYSQSETAFDGMYSRFENTSVPNGGNHILQSRNWEHEGSSVRAYASAEPDGATSYIIYFALAEGRDLRVRLSLSASSRLAGGSSGIVITPQDWPAMLAEVTDLMRSFEVPPNPAIPAQAGMQ
ncbi:hypothetical protein [Roseibium alexandrii]|uniref:hypothetical protein n=1 Tax=Roseibium alexandrii TaxID=388408 RepID=UPI003751F89C